MEHAIVVVIIVLAAGYVARSFLKKGKISNSCGGCGCSGCDTLDTCSDISEGSGDTR